MKNKCTGEQQLELAIRSKDGIDDCLYWRLVDWVPKKISNPDVDYLQQKDTNFLRLIKRLIDAGANPSFRFKELDFGSSLDLGCLNNYFVCKILLESPHLSAQKKHFISDKIEKLITSKNYGLLLHPLPKFGLSLLNGPSQKKIDFCLVDITHPQAKQLMNLDPSAHYINPPLNSSKPIIEYALSSWSNIASIKFNEVPYSDKNCRILFLHRSASSADKELGIHRNILTDGYFSLITLRIGRNLSQIAQRKTAIHEVGHALGFDHPRVPYSNMKNLNANGIPLREANYDYTIMSYVFSLRARFYDLPRSYPASPMVRDIELAQWLWGANLNYNRGNTHYSYNGIDNYLFTIWDAGGIDTLNTTNCLFNVNIDLNSNSPNPSYIGNTRVWIAKNTDIENVVTGIGNDIITGNHLLNRISSGEGDDIIITGPNESHINTGQGNDFVSVSPQTTYIYIEDCEGDRIDISEIVKDRCYFYEITSSEIKISSQCQEKKPILIQCASGLKKANVLSKKNFYIFELTNQFRWAEIGIGCLLGFFHVPFELLLDTMLLKLNNFTSSADIINNSEIGGIRISKQMIKIILRNYMTTRMAIAYDITSHVIMNYVDYPDADKPQDKIKHQVKAIAYSLKGFLEVGSMYLVSPVLTFFCTAINTFHSNFEKPKSPSPTCKDWLKRSFFAVDKVFDKCMYFIPGGKVIMDSLEEQENTIKKYMRG